LREGFHVPLEASTIILAKFGIGGDIAIAHITMAIWSETALNIRRIVGAEVGGIVIAAVGVAPGDQLAGAVHLWLARQYSAEGTLRGY